MVKKYAALFLFFSFFAANSYAQGWLWAKGNTGAGVDAWATATDPSGNVFGAGIVLGGGGNVTFGSVVIPASPLGDQCVLVKYDPSGNIQWAFGTQQSDPWLISIATDVNGNVFLFGNFTVTGLKVGSFTLNNTTGYMQYFLAKIDPSGNVLWAVNAGNVANVYGNLGFTVALGFGGIATDGSGNVYITTNFNQATTTVGSYTLTNADPSGSTDDILLVKYSPTGNVLWAKSTGGTGEDDAYGLAVTPAGDIYIAGQFGSTALTFGSSVLSNTSSTPVAMIARFDASGNPVWASTSGGTGYDFAVGIAADASNNVYLTGGFEESSIAFCGTTITNPEPGIASLYLAKFTPSNSISWTKTIYNANIIDSGGVWGFSIAMAQCGVIWVSGAMRESINTDSINIDGHILSGPSGSNDPVFIAGYTSSGVYASSGALSSGADDQNGIACDAVGNVYMCADYFSTYKFVAGNDTLAASDSTDELLYIAKFASINTSDSADFKHSFTSLCPGQSMILTAPSGYTDYFWNTGSYAKADTVSDTGLYFVSSSKNCTSLSVDSFMVLTSCNCSNALFVPNAFTPNGDGQDDVFYPRCGAGISQIKSFRVYDRWGELLFDRENLAPNDASNAWDGTYNGEKPKPDVFIWIVDGVCDNGSIFSNKGNVTLIR